MYSAVWQKVISHIIFHLWIISWNVCRQWTRYRIINHEVIFEVFQLMWPRYLSATDGQTDGQRAVAIPSISVALRGKTDWRNFRRPLKTCPSQAIRRIEMRVVNIVILYKVLSQTVAILFVNIICECEYFLTAGRYASAGLCESNVSVRTSVCHAPVLCQNEEVTSWFFTIL